MMKPVCTKAFTENGQNGNPAGVMVCVGDASWDEVKMQALAKALNYSETAFVTAIVDRCVHVRYFTPVCEVPMCGHATIATFSYLRDEGYIAPGFWKLQTSDGIRNIELCVDRVWIDMGEPHLGCELEDALIEKLLAAYGLESEDLDTRIRPSIIEAGLRDIHLIVRNHEALMKAVQDTVEVARISEALDVVGVHMSCVSEQSACIAFASNYAPYYGIDEECATGTSNAGLTYLLYEKGYMQADTAYSVLQGEHMGQPSRIFNKISLNQGKISVIIGGSAGDYE